ASGPVVGENGRVAQGGNAVAHDLQIGMRRHGDIDALSTRAAVHADAEKVHPLLVAERPTRLEHSHHGALGRNPEYPDRLAVSIGNYRRVEHAGLSSVLGATPQCSAKHSSQSVVNS